MEKYFFIIGIAFLSACGKPHNVEPIQKISSEENSAGVVNGVAVDQVTDPRAATLVSIEINLKMGTGSCTGTVISPRVVLTAAHCLEKALDVVVRFAASPVVGTVANWRSHPEYLGLFKARKSAHDFALIRLKNSIPKAVKIARLADATTPLKAGQLVSSYGYGYDSVVTDKELLVQWARKRGKKVLNKGNFIVVDLQKSVFKTWTDKSALCHGDSGGPTFLTKPQKPTVIGVNSFGSSDRCVDALNGVADVRIAREWIDSIVRRWAD